MSRHKPACSVPAVLKDWEPVPLGCCLSVRLQNGHHPPWKMELSETATSQPIHNCIATFRTATLPTRLTSSGSTGCQDGSCHGCSRRSNQLNNHCPSQVAVACCWLLAACPSQSLRCFSHQYFTNWPSIKFANSWRVMLPEMSMSAFSNI